MSILSNPAAGNNYCNTTTKNTMLTRLEKSLCLEIEHTSTLPAIDKEDDFLYCKKFLYQEKDVFRVGVKMSDAKGSPNPAFIFVLTSTNLQKMGRKVKTVISSVRLTNEIGNKAWRETEMKEIDFTTSSNANEGNGGTQYFIHQLKRSDIKCTDFNFYVTVHFTGIVENYQVQQIDDLLSDQLCLLATEGLNGAVLKLIASDGNNLPAHKWMLAARSPVFAALFSSQEDVTSLYLAVDCNAEAMEQFIRFIYTGELEGLVSQELAQLAIKYQIKTLEEICEAALKDEHFFTDKMALIALQMKSGSYFCKLENLPDTDLSGEKQETNVVSYFTCTWNVLNLNWTKETDDQETINMSVPFEHGGKRMFRAELVMRKNPKLAYTLKFLSFGHEDISCIVEDVICFIQQEDSSLNQRIRMTNETTKNDKILQVFSTEFTSIPRAKELTIPLTCPFVITFKARLSSTIPTFVNKMIDSVWSEQIWSSAVNRKMTDVELLIGEESFGAHRSLISARSPVFAAMFASGMKEAATGQVRIEDVDPSTFQLFLKFLYTGMFEPSSKDRELFTVADKYGVETLMELCRPATQTVDTEDVFKTFFSC